ncbi:MAG: Mth938-like domain-containing protein [Gammaproteobacteria bacterium]|nr:Mth938-like domain-containing protein [Gammaproteobacteria bacterium]MDH5628708.1 Mth938-like domain-containing protein [Gammaproteobacteria bacterium]
MQLQKEINPKINNIKSYQSGEINVNNQSYSTPILLNNSKIENFLQADRFNNLDSAQLLETVQEFSDELDILIIGTGDKHQLMPVSAMQAFIKAGIALEIMATRQACHTYQVLSYEQRKVVALLFP